MTLTLTRFIVPLSRFKTVFSKADTVPGEEYGLGSCVVFRFKDAAGNVAFAIQKDDAMVASFGSVILDYETASVLNAA